MLYLDIINSLLDVILITIPVLFIVALVTVAERRTLASMQRRMGPNLVGYWGLLQAFADAVKLLLKEYVSPTQANLILFFLGPIITLVFSLLGYAAIPYAPGLAISDFDLGILYMLAVSSLSTYGILLAGLCILIRLLWGKKGDPLCRSSYFVQRNLFINLNITFQSLFTCIWLLLILSQQVNLH
jgi:NADH:ubiquinone oxidoreductase subunit H